MTNWTSSVVPSPLTRSGAEILPEANAISSGTLSYLVDDRRYDVIDHLRAEWLAWLWLEKHQRFANWLDAWCAYRTADIARRAENKNTPGHVHSWPAPYGYQAGLEVRQLGDYLPWFALLGSGPTRADALTALFKQVDAL